MWPECPSSVVQPKECSFKRCALSLFFVYQPRQAKLFMIPISCAAPVRLESGTFSDASLVSLSTTSVMSFSFSSLVRFFSLTRLLEEYAELSGFEVLIPLSMMKVYILIQRLQTRSCLAL